MILGHVRDNFPHITLPLPGREGSLNVEFLIDTGFDGHLSLPPTIVQQLDAVYLINRTIRTADGTESKRRVYKIEIDWAGEPKTVFVIELDNDWPLLGVELLADNLVTVEMIDGGNVTIEPL